MQSSGASRVPVWVRGTALAVAVVASGLVVAFAVDQLQSRTSGAEETPTAVPAQDAPLSGVRRVAGSGHLDGPAVAPHPTSIPPGHTELSQTCGFYTEPVVDENAVHSVRHGAVWVSYRPDLPPDQFRGLQALTTYDPYVLVAPRAELPSTIVVTAWGAEMQIETSDDPRLRPFIRAFTLDPGAPEAGGGCAGIGTPRTPEGLDRD